MSEFTAPSLLDRLTDQDPANAKESSAAGQLSPRQMKVILRRDLIWLLTTIRLEEVTPLDDWPKARRAVINFGVRDLSGVPEQNIDGLNIQNTIRQAIWDFEPRLDRNSVNVKLIPNEEGEARGVAKLQISGRWAHEIYQNAIFIEAQIDFETGGIVALDG